MKLLKGIEHIAVGRIPGFGLFLGRKHQLFKEYLAKLFGRQYVESLSCKLVAFAFDLLRALFNSASE